MSWSAYSPKKELLVPAQYKSEHPWFRFGIGGLAAYWSVTQLTVDRVVLGQLGHSSRTIVDSHGLDHDLGSHDFLWLGVVTIEAAGCVALDRWRPAHDLQRALRR